jgi:thiamine-monophosphate kinase
MNEFDLIHRLTHTLPTNPSVVVGAGDDCAVLEAGIPDRLLLFKTDAVVEGVHFTPQTAPEKIGHKALGRCLSDIAAMAGTPTAALVTIGLPGKFSPEFVEAIYAGLNTLARRHQVAVVGGETTANPGGIFISVALLGWVPRGKGVLRSGAEVGDAIFVTGELGGSLTGKHLDFEPRLAEARWLAQEFSLHAMLDVSDGLAGDLRHLLAASRVGAELLATSIPISREARRAAKGRTGGVRPSLGAATSASGGASGSSSVLGGAEPAAPEDGRTPAKPPLLAALTDGEDFELLFTVASRDAVPLLDAWRKQFPGLALTCIGKIKAGEGITIRDKQGVRPLTAHGYVHFS